MIRRPPRSTPQSSRRQRQMCIRDRSSHLSSGVFSCSLSPPRLGSSQLWGVGKTPATCQEPSLTVRTMTMGRDNYTDSRKYFSFFFKILFIYDRHRERERQRYRRREKQAPCWEPDAELDPRTPGSRPGPKTDAKPLSHPGIPFFILLKAIPWNRSSRSTS